MDVLRKPMVAVVILLGFGGAGACRADEGCVPAIQSAEHRDSAIPPRLLTAIGLVESGRRDAVTGEVAPWPWAVNAEGEGHLFATRQQAIDFVRSEQARGVRSIDVGCMQVNLAFHPEAFSSLEDAFEPESNVRYAAAFLMDLRRRTGDWTTATGIYHSAMPELALAYRERVDAVLGGASVMPPASEWHWPGIAPATIPIPVFEPGAQPPGGIALRPYAKIPTTFGP